MKTIKQLKTIARSPLKKRQREMVKKAILYLETKPKEKYIKNEIEVLQKRIGNIADKYSYWSKNVCPESTKPSVKRRLFNEETGISRTNKQLSFLKFIVE